MDIAIVTHFGSEWAKIGIPYLNLIALAFNNGLEDCKQQLLINNIAWL